VIALTDLEPRRTTHQTSFCATAAAADSKQVCYPSRRSGSKFAEFIFLQTSLLIRRRHHYIDCGFFHEPLPHLDCARKGARNQGFQE
jgi:hypothetical protein